MTDKQETQTETPSIGEENPLLAVPDKDKESALKNYLIDFFSIKAEHLILLPTKFADLKVTLYFLFSK